MKTLEDQMRAAKLSGETVTIDWSEGFPDDSGIKSFCDAFNSVFAQPEPNDDERLKNHNAD